MQERTFQAPTWPEPPLPQRVREGASRGRAQPHRSQASCDSRLCTWEKEQAKCQPQEPITLQVASALARRPPPQQSGETAAARPPPWPLPPVKDQVVSSLSASLPARAPEPRCARCQADGCTCSVVSVTILEALSTGPGPLIPRSQHLHGAQRSLF